MTVQTVAGPIEGSELAFALFHEHVVMNSLDVALNWPHRFDRDALRVHLPMRFLSDAGLSALLAPQTEWVCTGFGFTEGPVWVPDDSCLLFSDIPLVASTAGGPARRWPSCTATRTVTQTDSRLTVKDGCSRASTLAGASRALLTTQSRTRSPTATRASACTARTTSSCTPRARSTSPTRRSAISIIRGRPESWPCKASTASLLTARSPLSRIGYHTERVGFLTRRVHALCRRLAPGDGGLPLPRAPGRRPRGSRTVHRHAPLRTRTLATGGVEVASPPASSRRTRRHQGR